MLLNKHNLSNAKHCSAEPVMGFQSEVLHITQNGTIASDGVYSISVSALSKHPVPISGIMTPDVADMTAQVIGEGVIEIDPSALPTPTLKVPVGMEFLADKAVICELKLSTNLLLRLAQEALDFGGDVIRLQFTGPVDPVRLDTNNVTTGQTWEALLMPRDPKFKKDVERFA